MNNSACAAIAECCANLLKTVPAQISHKNPSAKGTADSLGAVVYTIIILVLFASLIFLVMVRAIRPREDEQINVLLCSMRVRVDREEKRRHQSQLKDAKSRAQSWLREIAARKLSFRRTNSEVVEPSIRSLPLWQLRPRAASRANSYQGYLPDIVVTDEQKPLQTPESRCSSRKTISRQSSVFTHEDPSIHDFSSNHC